MIFILRILIFDLNDVIWEIDFPESETEIL